MAAFVGTMPWRVVAAVERDDTPPKLAHYDCVYECEHQRIYYVLDHGIAQEYYLPRPLCVNCKAYMLCIDLFGEELTDNLHFVVREEKSKQEAEVK